MGGALPLLQHTWSRKPGEGRRLFSLDNKQDRRIYWESLHFCLIVCSICYDVEALVQHDTFRLTWLCLLQVVDAQKRGIPHLYVVPCLALTFMFGPTGLLAYFVARAVTSNKHKSH